MTLTGPQEFGDPCHECGYRWDESPTQIGETHAAVHGALTAITAAEFGAKAQGLDWSVGEYVCHIGDNERIWAERFAAADTGQSPITVAPFDQDQLATSRNYRLIGYSSAMWSLRRAYQDFTTTSGNALRQATELHHPERGELSALDAIRTVVHDCHHHLWDIRHILSDTNRRPSG